MLFTQAQALATDASVIVDVGCGRGALVDPGGEGRRLHDLRAPGRNVIGIDLDPAAADNAVIDDFRLIKDDNWPLADGSVDLVYCDWVLEHVADAKSFMKELTRVLRPGGAFLARTVSRSSLLSLAARIIPNAHHARVVGRLQNGRPQRDVFPTMYRMNTLKDLGKYFNQDFEWSASFYPGLEHYATRWPSLARLLAVAEPRLPRRMQLALVVAARKR
ncbi:MAG: class I SAM-dependent methyltransferase [Actinomycetota bacterium]|nr:class I SAM-dependent methyltransferase [Actinomycetota bacterium]